MHQFFRIFIWFMVAHVFFHIEIFPLQIVVAAELSPSSNPTEKAAPDSDENDPNQPAGRDTTSDAVMDLTLSGLDRGNLPMSLQDVVAATLRNNVSIAVNEFNRKIRAEDIIDKHAEFDPTFSVDLSVEEETNQQASAFSAPAKARNKTHNWDLSLTQKLVTGADYELSFSNNRLKTNSPFSGLNPQYSSDLEFSLTQPLLKNFGIDLNKRDIYIASNDTEISGFEFVSTVIDTITEAENVYWDLVFSIEDLKVQQKALERARDLKRRVRAQVEVGTLAPLETLQAESEVASREEKVLTAEDLILDTEDKLKNILNLRFGTADGMKRIKPTDTPEMVEIDLHLQKFIKTALEHRPDYQARKKELENKNILVKYNENQLYPSLDLVGTLGLNGISGEAVEVTSGTNTGRSKFGGDYGTALSDTMSTKYFKWEVGVQFSYPLGNRSAKSKLSQARLEAAQLLLDIKDLEKSIVVEVREAARQLITDKKRVYATRVARRLAEEKLAAEEKKFEVGLSTSFEVLEFQEDLAEEQSNEIQAVIDFNKSRSRLRQVMATTLEEHNVKLVTENIGS